MYCNVENLKVDGDIAELIGAIFGDGNLWSNGRWYETTLTGDPLKDNDYFSYLTDLVIKKLGYKPYFRIRSGGIRITIKSKVFYGFLTDKLGIQPRFAKRKSSIPRTISNDRDLMKRFLRGLFDTDGSVFVSDKPGSSNYPTLEITNSNQILLGEAHSFLSSLGYRVNLRYSKGVYKLSLNGYPMIEKWGREIGSSNPYKLNKLQQILKSLIN